MFGGRSTTRMRCWTSPISRMASTHVSCTQVSAEAAIVDCFVAHSHAWVGPRQPPHCAEFFAAVATLFVQLNAAALPERDRDADRPDGNMHMCVPVRVLLPKLQALADDATIRYVVRLRVQASRLRVDTGRAFAMQYSDVRDFAPRADQRRWPAVR